MRRPQANLWQIRLRTSRKKTVFHWGKTKRKHYRVLHSRQMFGRLWLVPAKIGRRVTPGVFSGPAKSRNSLKTSRHPSKERLADAGAHRSCAKTHNAVKPFAKRSSGASKWRRATPTRAKSTQNAQSASALRPLMLHPVYLRTVFHYCSVWSLIFGRSGAHQIKFTDAWDLYRLRRFYPVSAVFGAQNNARSETALRVQPKPSL